MNFYGVISTNTVKEANTNFLHALGHDVTAATTRTTVRIDLEQKDSDFDPYAITRT